MVISFGRCYHRRGDRSDIALYARLSLEEKYTLCRSVAEECIQEDELRNLLDKKPNPIAYDGFEPSGRMHIAQVHDTPDLGSPTLEMERMSALC